MSGKKTPLIEVPNVGDLFKTDDERADDRRERVMDIPIDELHPFKDHPFKIGNDEDLRALAESIAENGVVSPAIARPRKGGGYELIAGHRRRAACRMAGVETMPVLVRDMDDDTATIIMVDSNKQRENVLPSEKAFAYKMRLEAVKRKAGRPVENNSVRVEQNLRGTVSRDNLAAEIGESASQIQRYIRLTNLVPELLQLVDDGKIALSPAVELSYLPKEHQQTLLEAMQEQDCTPSYSQSVHLKALITEGKLDAQAIYAMLAEPKANQREKITFQYERVKQFFPRGYTPKQIEDKIFSILEERQRQRQKKRDEPER